MVELTSVGIAATGVALKGYEYAKGAAAFWDRLQPTLRRKISVKIEKHFSDFGEYLDTTYDRATTVQLICSRAVKSHLNDVYVSCSFQENSHKNLVVTDNELISDIRSNKRIIVRGDGGSGKTLFMKRLWQTIYAEPMGKIPVFVELRNLNDFSKIDLITLIRHTLSTKKELAEDLFLELANDGIFLFILDGFDEVSVENREAVERQILAFDHRFKNCSIVISSRPNETFIGWKTFHKLDVMPFNLEKTLSLVGKAPIDKAVISRFEKLVTKDYFELHKEFLSSPLLALMMLLTLKQKGEISDNLIDFYDNAFHALYSEHDAIKEMFKRPHCMSITDFKIVFSTFCMFSYYKEKFDFKEAEIREFIDKSLKHVNLTKDPETKLCCSVDDFLYEICDSVSLLRKDGTEYVFNHRSFQEFFTANWIINIDNSKTERLLEVFALRPADNVISLAYQMNKPKVDKNYIIPFYERLLKLGLIHKSKSSSMSKWAYVEGYQLELCWTGRVVKAYDQNKKRDLGISVIPSWTNGEVGTYYGAIDSFIFNDEMRSKFITAISETIGSYRVKPLIDRIKEASLKKAKLSILVNSGQLKIRFSDSADSPDEMLKFISDGYPQFLEKVEATFDSLNEMLHELNKMVNSHIATTRIGQENSDRNLDEMFF